jgi:hypothetical protein
MAKHGGLNLIGCAEGVFRQSKKEQKRANRGPRRAESSGMGWGWGVEVVWGGYMGVKGFWRADVLRAV